MKVLFLDASPTMLAKNLLPIAKSLKEKYSNFEAIFLSLNVSSYVDPKIENSSVSKIISDDKFKYVSVKASSASEFLSKNKPDLVFIDGYRLFDMLWIAKAKENNIPTYKLQHGFEIENLYYKPHILISKFTKSIKVLKILYYLSKTINKSFSQMSFQYFQYFFSGKQLKDSQFNNAKLRPQKLFVYSDYYKDFWNKKFGLPKESMEIISPSDFQLIPKIQKMHRKNACCYLTQTLVEDGRMSKSDFDKYIIDKYIQIAKKIEHLVIKLHPRGNESLYVNLVALPNVSIMRDFPNCSVYLTHYSSTAYTAFIFSDSVILHELPGHSSPEVFKPVASLITSDIDSIIKEINENINNPQPQINLQKNKIQYYATVDSTDPISKISEIVLANFPE